MNAKYTGILLLVIILALIGGGLYFYSRMEAAALPVIALPADTPPQPKESVKKNPVAPAAGEEMPVAEGPQLVAGTGFVEPQPTPPAYDPTHPQAIARWSTVPDQFLMSPLAIGVVAFHAEGIDHVSFRANGGPALDVMSMTRNPHTGVYEYWVLLDPSAFTAERIEVRATAIPVRGAVRMLPQTHFYTHSRQSSAQTRTSYYVSPTGSDTTGQGTQKAPWQTIEHAFGQLQQRNQQRARAEICLLPGVHQLSNLRGHGKPGWLTITAAPGTRPGAVTLAGSGALRGLSLHLRDLTLTPAADKALINGHAEEMPSLWIDRCVVQGVGRRAHTVTPFGHVKLYATDSTWQDMRNGPVGGYLLRNVTCRRLLSDALTNSECVIGATVFDIDREDSDNHPDLFQIHQPARPMENVILYNVHAEKIEAQGIFVKRVPDGTRVRDVAFVNVLIAMTEGGDVYRSQWYPPADHVLFDHVTLPNQLFVWHTADLRNVVIRNSVFYGIAVTDAALQRPLSLALLRKNNHLVEIGAHLHLQPASGSTHGDPRLGQLGNLRFHPLPNSPLLERIDAIAVPADLEGVPLRAPAAIGAYQPRGNAAATKSDDVRGPAQ